MPQLTDIRLFVALMCAIIAVQGAYLGYIVGVLTDIEKRFQLSSSRSGFILSMYDIGHTATVLFVGQLLANRHKPKWIGIGVIISALAMFSLTFPNWVFGSKNYQESEMKRNLGLQCNPLKHHQVRKGENIDLSDQCRNEGAHEGAYAILCLAQLLAGVAAAPFNTIAYIYVDENIDSRKSPFYLGKSKKGIEFYLIWADAKI